MIWKTLKENQIIEKIESESLNGMDENLNDSNEDKDTKYISMHPIEVIAKSYNLT